MWPRGLLGVARGRRGAAPPDAVVWPTSTEEVRRSCALRARARHADRAVRRRLGRVRRRAADPRRHRRRLEAHAHAASRSTRRAGAATFEAGIIGEHFEHELDRRGFTLGHFPSSIMCSTFGGWLATRSAGQLLDASTARSRTWCARPDRRRPGAARCSRPTDAGAARPELDAAARRQRGHARHHHARARCASRPAPQARLYRGLRVRARRRRLRGDPARSLQRGLRPAVVRLYDELDTFMHRWRQKIDEPASAPRDRSARRDGALPAWLALLDARRGMASA